MIGLSVTFPSLWELPAFLLKQNDITQDAMDIHWHPLTSTDMQQMLQWTSWNVMKCHGMSWNVMECHGICIAMPSYWNQFLVPQSGPRSQFHHPTSFKALWMSFGVVMKTACNKFSKILQNCQGSTKNSVFSHALPDSIIFTSFHILMVFPPYKPCSLSLRSTIFHFSQFLPDSNDPMSTICSTVPACASRASCATCVQAMDLSRSPAAPLLREAKGTEVLIFSKLGILSPMCNQSANFV